MAEPPSIFAADPVFMVGGNRVPDLARDCLSLTVEEGDHRLLSGSLNGTVRAIAEAGGRAIAVPADLARQEDRARLVVTCTGKARAVSPCAPRGRVSR